MLNSIIILVVLLGIVSIGVYIAHRVSNETKLVVRVILLLPMLSAVVDLNILLVGNLIVGYLDIMREISILVVYVLIGCLLKGDRLIKNIDSIVCNRGVQI